MENERKDRRPDEGPDSLEESRLFGGGEETRHGGEEQIQTDCGAEQARPGRKASDGTETRKRALPLKQEEYQKLLPGAKRCMRAAALISGVLRMLILSGLFLAAFFAGPPWTLWTAGMLLALGGIYTIFALTLFPVIRYERYRYKIDEDMIDVIRGLWFIERTLIPMERVQKISVERGPVKRLYGLAEVSVTTAGGEGRVDYLEEALADRIAEQLKTRINRIVFAQKKEAASEAAGGAGFGEGGPHV